MLGKTAAGLYWMCRYLERIEFTTRLLDAAFRIALTNSNDAKSEWGSIILTTGNKASYLYLYDEYESTRVINFLLREKSNPSSVLSVIETARNNARIVRTALTRESWEAINECWLELNSSLRRPITENALPQVLSGIRKQNSLVRAALDGTMLRNDIYNFLRLGTFIERADSTARILDVKYYVLLPSLSQVGSSIDFVQWESILRSVSALRAYRWLHGNQISSKQIANFLILDERMSRSLTFCLQKINNNLFYLSQTYQREFSCRTLADNMFKRLQHVSIDKILLDGLHEYLITFLSNSEALNKEIETNFGFYG